MPVIKGATPVMKQFWEAKKSHPDAIMLFRMGDFYETFDKDAKLASEILGITLTRRANGAASTVPLAGFPYHSLDQYLHKLLAAGHRVAICEQVEDPKLAKGIVKREVVEVVSPGTALTDNYLDQNENNYLASVFFKERKVGISILDHSTGEFITSEWDKDELINIIRQFNPTEILVAESQKNALSIVLGKLNLFITDVPDWVFELESAYEILTNHFNTSNLKGFGIEEFPLSISSAGGALFYIQENFMGRTKHITNLSLHQSESYMGVDSYTIRNLEIFKSLASQGHHGTLISVVDNTVTSSGSRLLKQWFRTPLHNIDEINERLNRVSELVSNIHLRADIRKEFRQVSDIDRILVKISTSRATPRDIYQLGKSLDKIQVFKDVFSSEEPALERLFSTCEDTSNIVKIIEKTICDDPPIKLNKGGYINRGFSKQLDEYHEISVNANSWLVKYQAELKESTRIPTLKIGYNKVFGFYIDVTRVHSEKVPDEFIRKQTLTNSERYFTTELKDYETKILEAEKQIVHLETQFFEELNKDILISAKEIQANARILAALDIAAGLAEVANTQDYVRPELEKSSRLEIIDSRHPVVETLLPLSENFIPNDVKLDQEKEQIGIITGPNMAGKSTYIRQVGLIVLMAHAGSFVPAKKAVIGLVDKLFTRVGASDNLAGGESTFLVEMNETANILNNASPESLILLDEIGRGTSTYDGLSIAWSVVEYLHNKPEVAAKTLFATHYHELVELADDLNRAFNLNVAVKEFGNKVIFLRKIIDGGADKSYGVHVAEMAGLPRSIIERSHQILAQLTANSQTGPQVSHQIIDITQGELFDKEDSKLKEEITEIDINSMTPMEALNVLNELKRKHDLH